MSRPVYIYGLRDPRTDSVVYVGKTINVNRRVQQICKPNSPHTGAHLRDWVAELKSLRLQPTSFVIEECSNDNWRDKEQFWIWRYRKLNPSLLNTRDGGEGRQHCTEGIPYTLSLPDQMHRRLMRDCEESHSTPTQIVRLAIDHYRATRPAHPSYVKRPGAVEDIADPFAGPDPFGDLPPPTRPARRKP